MKHYARIAAALLLCACCSLAFAQIRVGSVADSRGASGWTLDGANQSATRAKLLNTANFGPGGVVSLPVTIADTNATITAGLLANFDVFYIGYFPDGTFSAGELSALQTWVNGGGTVIATCDDSGYSDVCTLFGHTPTTSASPPVTPTVAGSTHPLFAGPFGSASGLGMGGTEGYFAAAGGATVLGQDTASHPVVMVQTFGAGRVIFLSDVDLIANFYSGTLSAGSTISNANDRFLGNLFAFAGSAASAPPPPTVAQPVPALDAPALVLLALLLGLGSFVALRRRA